jgi:hypothetical protein
MMRFWIFMFTDAYHFFGLAVIFALSLDALVKVVQAVAGALQQRQLPATRAVPVVSIPSAHDADYEVLDD